MTYYTSLNYTNYTLVTDWYVAGNEIADHTLVPSPSSSILSVLIDSFRSMTHVGAPPNDEIDGNIIALNALAGIPLSAISGFRAPYLNYTAATLTHLAAVGFTYDSSATSSIPVNESYTDAFWPYTLDYGMANDCLTGVGLCKGQPKLPGFWEVPMYALFDNRGINGIHLMDPWLCVLAIFVFNPTFLTRSIRDPANGASTVNDNATLAYLQANFMAHYSGSRQPFGLYTHPIHTAVRS
jgi:hypothetical protein